MLSSRAKLFLNSSKSFRIICSAHFSTPQKFDSAQDNLIAVEKKKIEPFMKNIFLGIADPLFLQYPEPKNKELSEKFQKFMKGTLDSFSEDLSINDKFKLLVEQGILKCRLPECYGGIDMTHTELFKLYEELKLDPSLTVLLETHSSLILQTILNHGSDQIKSKYLGGIISGELTGAYAISEEGSGSDPTSIKSVAKEEEDCFKLTGEKIWVTNGENADFFLVFANNIINNRSSMVSDLSVYLVEKNDGLSFKKHNLLGLNSCGLCKVKFENLAVPKSNLIGSFGEGFQIAGDGLKYHKYITLITIINNLKYFLSSAVSYVNERKQFPIDLKDCELVKDKLTSVTFTIYTLESMLYLTGGILDHFIMDDAVESGILQMYGIEKGLEAISQCMDLLGSRAYDVSFPFEKLWRDLKGLSLCFKSVDIIKLYVSLIGVHHAGNNLKNIVMKSRNPFNYPGFIFKRALNNAKQEKDNPKLHLKLYMNLHPSLKSAAEQLEYCILRLQYIVEVLLIRHGSELVKRQLELKRIADIAGDIYAMVAVLSRASKSYCTGVQYCDQEITIATAWCYTSYMRVKNNSHNILHPEKKLNDVYTIDIASHIFKNNSYSFEHPLKQNIV